MDDHRHLEMSRGAASHQIAGRGGAAHARDHHDARPFRRREPAWLDADGGAALRREVRDDIARAMRIDRPQRCAVVEA